jgi:hypothetical protein
MKIIQWIMFGSIELVCAAFTIINLWQVVYCYRHKQPLSDAVGFTALGLFMMLMSALGLIGFM